MRAADFQGVIVTTAVRNPVRVPCMSDVMKSLRKLENFLRSIIWVCEISSSPPCETSQRCRPTSLEPSENTYLSACTHKDQVYALLPVTCMVPDRKA